MKAHQVQCDEIWSFTYAKAKNVAGAKATPERAGDTWIWSALCRDSKLIVSYLMGGRDSEYALAFMDDLRGRPSNRVQLTTDGHRAYLRTVEEAFGDDIDYAQLVKLYGSRELKGRYSRLTASAPARNGSPAILTARWSARRMSSGAICPCGCICAALLA